MRTLTAWRSHFGLTQQQLAELTNTTKGEISRLEGGKRRLTIEWLRRFAQIYRVPPEALMKPPPSGLGEATPARPLPSAPARPVKADDDGMLVVTDDGMAPTLQPGDEVELDLEDRDARTPGLFAIREGARVSVRRVQRAGDILLVGFDNPAYRAYEAQPGEALVLGRAVRRTHRL